MSTTFTAGSKPNAIAAHSASNGISTFITRNDRTRSPGLRRRYSASSAEVRKPTVSAASAILTPRASKMMNDSLILRAYDHDKRPDIDRWSNHAIWRAVLRNAIGSAHASQRRREPLPGCHDHFRHIRAEGKREWLSLRRW